MVETAAALFGQMWTKVVGPDDVWVLENPGTERLTLVTCFPFYFVGSAPNRFVIRAQEELRVRLPGADEESTGADIESARPKWVAMATVRNLPLNWHRSLEI